jgi:hypothetical protein
MNLRSLFILLAAASLCSGIAAAQSEMPQSPAQDGTLKALAAIAGAADLETDDLRLSQGTE